MVIQQFGIQLLKSLLAVPFNAATIEMVVPVTDANPIYVNDLVSTTSNSDVSGENFGVEYCTRTAVGGFTRGVVTSIKPLHQYENSIYRQANTYRLIRVCQDPFLLCKAVVNAPILETDVNRYINTDNSGGNNATGVSSIGLDYATIGDVSGQFKITKIIETADTYSIVECIIQKHELLQGIVHSSDIWQQIANIISPTVAGSNVDLGTGTILAANGKITGNLEVDGIVDPAAVVYEPQTSAPITTDGAMYYDGTNLKFRIGSTWYNLNQSGGGITALTGDVVATGPGSVTATIQPNVVTLAKMAQLGAMSVIGNATGSAATPSTIGVSTTISPFTIPIKDVNGMVQISNIANGLVEFTSVANAMGALTVASPQDVIVRGSAANFSVRMPDVTGLPINGVNYTIYNKNTVAINIVCYGGTAILTMQPNTTCKFSSASTTSNVAASWPYGYILNQYNASNITNDSTVLGATVKDALNTLSGSIFAFNTDPANVQMDGTAAVGSTGLIADAGHIHPSDTSRVATSLLGAVNGVATLNSLGNIPDAQIPAYVLGDKSYQGTWDASGGVYPATPSSGQYWTISVAGTMGGVAYAVNDEAIYYDSAWSKVSGTASVAQMNAWGTTWTGGTNIATLGTITTGTWHGNTITGTYIAANTVALSNLSTLAANSVIGNTTGSGATPTAVSLVSTATATSVMLRDSNANTQINSLIQNVATTVTASGTTTLTVASAPVQQFTGSAIQTVVLPNATTLGNGTVYEILNRSTGVVTVNMNGASTLQAMAGATQMYITLMSNGTAAGTWDTSYLVDTSILGLTNTWTGNNTFSGTVTLGSGVTASQALVVNGTKVIGSVAYAVGATAFAMLQRDTNKNANINAIIQGSSSTTTAAGTTTLTVASTPIQEFTGTSTQTLVLPDATTLSNGMQYQIFNRSTLAVTVNMNGGSTLQAILGNTKLTATLISNGTAAGTWDVDYLSSGTLVQAGAYSKCSITVGPSLAVATGSYCTCINGGGGATGNSNSFLGQGAGGTNAAGSANTGFGVNTLGALSATNNGAQNLALGASSGQSLTTGSNNLFIGCYAGFKQTTANSTFLVSNQTSYMSSAAVELTNSLLYGTFGTTGSLTGQQLTVNGTFNVNGTIASGTWNGAVIGSSYGGAGTVSGMMKANGSGTVSAATAGTDYVAPPTVSGPYCTNFGYQAGNVATNTGNYCTYMGYQAGANAHTGGYNAVLGASALYTNITGGYCTAVGASALYNIGAVNGCVGIGYCAGYNNAATANEFYVNNVMQGNYTSDQTCSLLYGTFAGSAGSITGQQLTVNGVLNVNSAAYVNANIGANGGYSNSLTLTFPGTQSPCTVSAACICSRINNTITISMAAASGTSTNANSFQSSNTIDTAYCPTVAQTQSIVINVGGNFTVGWMKVNPNGIIQVFTYQTNGYYPATGTAGWFACSATYNV